MSYFNILLIGYYCQTMNIFNWCVFKNSVYLCILLTPKLFDTLFFFFTACSLANTRRRWKVLIGTEKKIAVESFNI